MRKTLVTGAGGFIGHHLTRRLKDQGHWVRGVDLKHPEFQASPADEFLLGDLRDPQTCRKACHEIEWVFALAADMGGMGFISENHSQTFHNNALIDLHTIEAAHSAGCTRLFYASSACVYPEHRQSHHDISGLRESEAYPAAPQDAYGWEKLFGERLCHFHALEHPLQFRIGRFHNVFGPHGCWQGGREKAPAAICRKVALAAQSQSPTIEVWGDGQQTRSFCYIDDCLDAVLLLMESDYDQPLNIGQDRMISINELVAIVSQIANHHVDIAHVDGPQGVRGRNSDNSLARSILAWEPKISLEEGLRRTYEWIFEQTRQQAEALSPS